MSRKYCAAHFCTYTIEHLNWNFIQCMRTYAKRQTYHWFCFFTNWKLKLHFNWEKSVYVCVYPIEPWTTCAGGISGRWMFLLIHALSSMNFDNMIFDTAASVTCLSRLSLLLLIFCFFFYLQTFADIENTREHIRNNPWWGHFKVSD